MFIGAAAVVGILATLVNLIGGVMWDMAESMPLWWEGNNEPEERDY